MVYSNSNDFISLYEIGGLSKPRKMPNEAWSIPASKCITGSKLAKVKGSICYYCYANKGRYRMGNVIKVLKVRYEAWQRPHFTEEFIKVLNWKMPEKAKKSRRYFRWFDSGDLQSMKHLCKIVKIAKALPHIYFWLPTHEPQFIQQYVKYREFPSNLTVRLSAIMVDENYKPKWWKWVSTVHKNKKLGGYQCPAHNQDNKCKDCRACWDKRVRSVSYNFH